ncbi:MAG: prephenate dehydratase [Nitriliruptoraceae bacterium]
MSDDQRVGYLGPAGTFTEAAARLVTGIDDDERLVPFGDVSEVLRAVDDGQVVRAVVPIENTLEGSVTATLDALAFDSDLFIEGEVELPITLMVAGPAGTALGEVTAVHSHPVALAGSRRWLNANVPNAERVAAPSTARAAEDVAATQGAVAIVNQLAAERCGLEILARDVADRAGNTTRFVVVGTAIPRRTGWDKTSIVVFIEANRPGALLQLLEIFAERELNLTKIESRPTKAELGEYCFFLDTEGHLADERVGDALAAVKRTHRDVKILGSYRRSGARQTTEADRIHADDEAYRSAAAWLAEWRARIASTD